MNTPDKLLGLKSEIDQAKTRVSELTGQKQGLMKELKDNWQCTTLKQAEKKAEELEKEISAMTGDIEKGVAEIEEKYEL